MADVFLESRTAWDRPEVQEAFQLMKGLYPDENRWRELLENLHPQAVDPSVIRGGAIHYVWRETFAEAARAGTLRALLAGGAAARPGSPAAARLNGLLDGARAAAPEPRDEAGRPGFVVAEAQGTVPEKLLFGDDLTVDMGVLQMLVEHARAVCLVRVKVGDAEACATGVRIAPDLVLTNHHVVYPPPRGQLAEQVLVEFGFERDRRGEARQSRTVVCDATPVAADAGDDWAVVRARESIGDDWPALDLSDAATVAVGDPAFIIQHPGGQYKRAGLVRNRVERVHERAIHYLTDTQRGSSGAPVFDRRGRIVALHHAGGDMPVDGQRQFRNEGIPMARILAGLRGAGILLT